MRKLKRLIALTVAFVMLLSVVPAFGASEYVTITAENVTGSVGETVEVPIELSGNDGIGYVSAIVFNITYDPGVLELTDTVVGDIVSTAEIEIKEEGSVAFSWSEPIKNDQNGILCTLVFTIKREASSKIVVNSPIVLSYNGKSIDAATVAGSVSGLAFETATEETTEVETETHIDAEGDFTYIPKTDAAEGETVYSDDIDREDIKICTQTGRQ